MNMFDKNLLFEMSFALMRRFTFIEVPSPDEAGFRALLAGPGEEVVDLLPLRALKDLGPAIFLDAASYAARRNASVSTRSRLLYEVFYGYLLPSSRASTISRRGACSTCCARCSTRPSRWRPAAPSRTSWALSWPADGRGGERRQRAGDAPYRGVVGAPRPPR